MPECRTPYAKRMQRSDNWRRRYRTDPEFRLKRINERRAAAGKPLATELPPVGEAKRAWAAGRERDDKGQFIPEQDSAQNQPVTRKD